MQKSWLIYLFLGTATLLPASDIGAELTESKCTVCHMTSSSSAKLKDGKMHAPPMWGVMKKVKQHFKDPQKGMDFIVDYTMEPQEAKMLFPEATKTYFGVMPSMRGDISEKEMHLIAEYLYKKQF